MPAKEENCKERLKDGGKAALFFFKRPGVTWLYLPAAWIIR